MPGCGCGRQFPDEQALSQHRIAKHPKRQGGQSQSQSQSHGHGQNHHICDYCDRRFSTRNGLQQHIDDVHTWECGHCDRDFSSENRLDDHQRSTGHCYCRDCDRFFDSRNALRQHLDSSIHTNQFYCSYCDRDFTTDSALEQHRTDKNHGVRPKQSAKQSSKQSSQPNLKQGPQQGSKKGSQQSLKQSSQQSSQQSSKQNPKQNPKQNSQQSLPNSSKQSSDRVCRECNREFGDAQALENHRASGIHDQISNIKCISSKNGRGGCQRSFASPSALLHHLESGACRSGVTREKINFVVQAIITNEATSDPPTASSSRSTNVGPALDGDKPETHGLGITASSASSVIPEADVIIDDQSAEMVEALEASKRASGSTATDNPRQDAATLVESSGSSGCTSPTPKVEASDLGTPDSETINRGTPDFEALDLDALDLETLDSGGGVLLTSSVSPAHN